MSFQADEHGIHAPATIEALNNVSRGMLKRRALASEVRHANIESRHPRALWNYAVDQNNVALAEKLLEAGLYPSHPAPEPAPQMRARAWDNASPSERLRADLLPSDFERNPAASLQIHKSGRRLRPEDIPAQGMLRRACLFKSGRMVGCLVAAGINPDRLETWDNPLHQAARLGNVNAVKAMLRTAKDTTMHDGNGYTPALAAVSDVLAASNNELLDDEKGAPRPFFYARSQVTKDDRWAIVSMLLKDHHHSEDRNEHGDLLDAALDESSERSRWFIDKFMHGHVDRPQERLERLLEKVQDTPYGPFSAMPRNETTTNVTEIDENGETHEVSRVTFDGKEAWEDLWKTVDLLLDHGADMRKANTSGCPPFIQVADQGGLTLLSAKTLIEHGANPNDVDEKGRSLLHALVACQRLGYGTRTEDTVKMVEFLKSRGWKPDVAQKTRAGETPHDTLERVSKQWTVASLGHMNALLERLGWSRNLSNAGVLSPRENANNNSKEGEGIHGDKDGSVRGATGKEKQNATQDPSSDAPAMPSEWTGEFQSETGDEGREKKVAKDTASGVKGSRRGRFPLRHP